MKMFPLSSPTWQYSQSFRGWEEAQPSGKPRHTELRGLQCGERLWLLRLEPCSRPGRNGRTEKGAEGPPHPTRVSASQQPLGRLHAPGQFHRTWPHSVQAGGREACSRGCLAGVWRENGGICVVSGLISGVSPGPQGLQFWVCLARFAQSGVRVLSPSCTWGRLDSPMGSAVLRSGLNREVAP